MPRTPHQAKDLFITRAFYSTLLVYCFHVLHSDTREI